MADTPEQILSKEADLLIDEFVVQYDKLGMRASGQWANTLDNRTSGLTLSIFGQDYTEFLVDGRKPGKFPPIAKIEQWIKDKGIAPIERTIKISSLAFLIARKIAREGTEYFKQGGTDLVEAVVTPQRIQDIIDKVSVFFIGDFVSRFVKEFQQIAKA